MNALARSQPVRRQADAGPVLQIRYAKPTPVHGRHGGTHYNPPCLIQLLRGVLAELEVTWRQVEAVAGVEPQFVVLRFVDAKPPRPVSPPPRPPRLMRASGEILATLVIVSDHEPLTIERVHEAVMATRFGGQNGWAANPRHLSQKSSGED